MVRNEAGVAVVVITYNRSQELLRTLGHLSHLPEQPPIIVVNNGSPDAVAEAMGSRFPDVKVIDAGGNLGTVARNLGIEAAESPYVALCDDDTWWEAGALRR
jgi:N-acetylglucosaminyl-diphospho-decaprenol L-rhamnosyltransferase